MQNDQLTLFCFCAHVILACLCLSSRTSLHSLLFLTLGLLHLLCQRAIYFSSHCKWRNARQEGRRQNNGFHNNLAKKALSLHSTTQHYLSGRGRSLCPVSYILRETCSLGSILLWSWAVGLGDTVYRDIFRNTYSIIFNTVVRATPLLLSITIRNLKCAKINYIRLRAPATHLFC